MVTKEQSDFNAIMLNALLWHTMSDKINFTEITGWHNSHPYLRLNIYNGGLTSWLYDNKNPNAMVVSYDIDGSINHTKRTDIDFRVEDCFEEKSFNEIISYIQRPGKTLFVCDGGDKPKEFSIFSEYLKSGDVIIAHDYAKNPEYWKFVTNYWQWPYESDTNYDSIRDAIIKNGLEPYRDDEFNFYLWTSYIKK